MFTGSRASSSQTTVRTTEETMDSQDREEDGGTSISSPSFPPSHNSASPASFAEPPADQSTCSPEVPAPAALPATIHPNLLVPLASCPPLFTIEQLGIDRRLLVNRKRQLKMYRVWMQGKFKKLSGVAALPVDQVPDN